MCCFIEEEKRRQKSTKPIGRSLLKTELWMVLIIRASELGSRFGNLTTTTPDWPYTIFRGFLQWWYSCGILE